MSFEPLNLGDRPLDLEQDQFIRLGRLPICQPRLPEDSMMKIDFQVVHPPCPQTARELHQIDFQPWVE